MRHHCPTRPAPRRIGGFTLYELLAVVVIIAIVATFAYASYAKQIQKAQRAVAKSALLEAATRQEQYFFSNRSYTNQLDKLAPSGYYAAGGPTYFGKDGSPLSSSTGAIYALTATTSGCGDTPCFKLTAAPVTNSSQAGDACGSYTLDSRNVKGAAASGCW